MKTQKDHEKQIESFYSTGLGNIHKDTAWELTFGYWEKDTDSYSRAAQNLWGQLFDKINITNESIVVSVGCGMGFELLHLYRTYSPKKIIGIDLTKEHIDRATILIEKNGLSEVVQLIHGSGLDLCNLLPNLNPTHIINIEATSQMLNRNKFVSEAFRILAPGGYLGVCDAIILKKSKFYFPLTWITANLWKVPMRNITTTLTEELVENKFDVTTTEIGHQVWPGYVKYKRKDFASDVRMRGYIFAILFILLNEALSFSYKAKLLGYSVFIGKKPFNGVP